MFKTGRENLKVLVIGDMFSRYEVTVPLSDKGADMVMRLFFDRWVFMFEPPVQLLTDFSPKFASRVIAGMLIDWNKEGFYVFLSSTDEQICRPL
jgi:hypothetical protein